MAERITVSGFRRPHARITRARRIRVPLVDPRNLIWVGVLASLPLAAWVWGTPYLLVNYTYTGPSFARTYQDCRYVGRDTRDLFPRDGRCPLIRLLKPDTRD